MQAVAPVGSALELWERLRKNAPLVVRAMLADMSIVSLKSGVATLACDERVRTTAEKKLGELGQLMSSLAGSDVRCVLAESNVVPNRSAQPAEETTAGGDTVEIDDPVVRHAIEIFNGRIIEVKPLPRSTEEES